MTVTDIKVYNGAGFIVVYMGNVLLMPGMPKNLNYLIAGEKAGSKLDKAQKLGVTVISQNEFLGMI